MEALSYSQKGLSGSTLKLIAIIAMVIDHIGAALLGRFLMSYGYLDAVMSGSQEEIATWISGHSTLYLAYWVIRMIGRVAFPIFCFLLVEGFQRTRHMKKYVLRLGLFAILSEIPFDLATHSQVLEFTYQNVFFTLFFGLVAMIGYDQICRRQWFSAKKVDQFAKLLLCVLILLVCCTAADFLRTDYGSIGVLCITVLYVFRRKKPLMIVAGCIAFLWEFTAPLAFLPIAFYNGKRGLRLKYVFYLFYPVHLLILYLIALSLGVAGYPAL